jgi:hypothetical protein
MGYMRTNLTETPSRIYFTVHQAAGANPDGSMFWIEDKHWHASYQPRNPKTGKPWQASQHLLVNGTQAEALAAIEAEKARSKK